MAVVAVAVGVVVVVVVAVAVGVGVGVVVAVVVVVGDVMNKPTAIQFHRDTAECWRAKGRMI